MASDQKPSFKIAGPFDELCHEKTLGVCIMGIIFSANSFIHFASLFPFLGENVGDFGNKEEDIGMYAKDSKAGNRSLINTDSC